MKKQEQIKQGQYTSAGFIRKYQQLVSNTVIPYQYSVLNDKAEGAEKSHVVQNFVNAAKAIRGEDTGDGFYGMVFQDSDAAKWLEAAAYSLKNFPDPDLENQADELIDLIVAAQDKDGYLNTYFTIKDKEKRWSNLLEAHELYCSGHMIEAACAYYECTGKRKLLDAMQKNVAHIYNVFIKESHAGFPGHPEIELALMKMYRITKDNDCLELAKHFIDTRGTD
ncbi:MAG: glycoside hydrolase family 127 protein, partial [Lachnospiraceae bacterium]|nr:glycoside hydrolase family 127 protein [Lachnospiraceae bacterium]